MPRHLLTSTPLSDDADIPEPDLLDCDLHYLHIVGEMVFLIGVERFGNPFLARNRAKPQTIRPIAHSLIRSTAGDRVHRRHHLEELRIQFQTLCENVAQNLDCLGRDHRLRDRPENTVEDFIWEYQVSRCSKDSLLAML